MILADVEQLIYEYREQGMKYEAEKLEQAAEKVKNMGLHSVAHSRWLEKLNDFGIPMPMCKRCRQTALEKTDYCPNCGAVMEDEDAAD